MSSGSVANCGSDVGVHINPAAKNSYKDHKRWSFSTDVLYQL